MIYNFYLYNRQGVCLYQKDLKRGSKQQRSDTDKLLYGLLYSLKKFAEKISPNDKKRFRSYKTATYKLHCFETPTGLKFVMCTDLSVGNIDRDLEHIFAHIYVPHVVRNPLAELHVPMTPTTTMQPLPSSSSSSGKEEEASDAVTATQLQEQQVQAAAAASGFDAALSAFLSSLKYY
ncbi:hypothetical protein PTSG_08336 [Salpingoeca rosetta]|uniref:Trafficking protein particle complex subunit n=1 Tax=Salpingoeca rosetta (strain ATCC 50818 / BSB-021) TaxID=946362 RepID=F2UJE5_SALR5|nr:uncharacterized protein PTSG_08336 [Salpingoeca rosetta]EGD77244.1 hypothetical protein PTSG_08336 [Salpingoeca rosetta]|eukprot:XP_004990588.1 hypothetical protein PTSG_08336 [Salpingoeca rosetta]